MSAHVSTEIVWEALRHELFACLSFVNPAGEARAAGIVYVVEGGELFIATERESWKARHIAKNPHVALVVPIAKRIPFLPWIKIPAATINFAGTATVMRVDELGAGVRKRLLRSNAASDEDLASACVLRVKPVGDFVTYGVGTTMWGMRDHKGAQGRAPVA